MSSSLSLSNKIEPLIHIHNAIYLLSVEIFCLKYLKNFRIEFLQIKMCFLKHMYNKKENIILINRELWMHNLIYILDSLIFSLKYFFFNH